MKQILNLVLIASWDADLASKVVTCHLLYSSRRRGKTVKSSLKYYSVWFCLLMLFNSFFVLLICNLKCFWRGVYVNNCWMFVLGKRLLWAVDKKRWLFWKKPEGMEKNLSESQIKSLDFGEKDIHSIKGHDITHLTRNQMHIYYSWGENKFRIP
jgi:hypothetical protein